MEIIKTNGLEIWSEVAGSNFTLTLSKGHSNLKKVVFLDGSAAAMWKDGSVTRSVSGTLNAVREWGINFYSGIGFDLWPIGVEVQGVKYPFQK